MFGKAYTMGRHAQRFTGGGGRLRPNNNSEVIFSLVFILFMVFLFASCVAVFTD